MSELPPRFALLIAAHGERRDGAGNDGVAALAADLARRGVADEVSVGFIKGVPAIDEAVRAFAAAEVLVYPLFLADGYFNRVRLPQLLAKAGGRRRLRVLTPLGLDPALVALVADAAQAGARQAGFTPARTALVLLAHGSPSDPASRLATQTMAARIAALGRFDGVRAAFLEEPPTLADALAPVAGPAVVVGLFAGEGLHGGADVPQLMRELGRDDVAFVGNVGAFAGIADIVAASVGAASTEAGNQVD